MPLPNAALEPARTRAAGKLPVGARAAVLALAITLAITMTMSPAMASAAAAKPAPASDIATTIMADPHYATAAKAYARRRGYQAERPVAKRSNFLPVVSLVAVAATGVTFAAKGIPASH